MCLLNILSKLQDITFKNVQEPSKVGVIFLSNISECPRTFEKELKLPRSEKLSC